jgi:hypothetical protein
VRLAFLSTGLAFPEMGTACELGFGQGLSANIHAVYRPSTFCSAQAAKANASAGVRMFSA